MECMGQVFPYHLDNSCWGAASYIFDYIPRVCMQMLSLQGMTKYIFLLAQASLLGLGIPDFYDEFLLIPWALLQKL